MSRTRFLIVMGVSGSGKTTVGRALAQRLGWDFYDADDFHPPANIAKMASGVPLTDEDRAPWLDTLHTLISQRLKEGRPGVLACSALKERYRQRLLEGNDGVQIVYLKGSYDLIRSRMENRTGHFMKAELLRSQFETLEEPLNALAVDISLPVEKIVEHIVRAITPAFHIGILGLGVMGRALAQNLHRNGWRVVGYDPAPEVTPDFPMAISPSVAELISALETPRILLLMVPSERVDEAIESLRPYLQEGDVVIDGGNSFFGDTERRIAQLGVDGIIFIGMGVSGGEKGALFGPSLMPGGAEEGWERVRPILESIAARGPDGTPCVAWMGRGGAGHYVKMVHNGVEYALMQLIAETYDLLHRGAGIPHAELATVFDEWNRGELKSYLLEITADILRRKEDGADWLDGILDVADQKGTGKWTTQNALDLGVPIPTISAAVESRFLSGLKAERQRMARRCGGDFRFDGDRMGLIGAAREALFASMIVAYAQGFSLLKRASEAYRFGLNLSEIARVWQAGCIVRAELLAHIRAAFEQDPALPNLLMDDFFCGALLARQSAWRQTLQTAIRLGIPMPAESASLAYFDAYRSERLPANLIQAQRHTFGRHPYRRIGEWQNSAGEE
jgi:6-phosphogluconate dehydrogenase